MLLLGCISCIVSMTITASIAVSDPFLNKKWKFYAVWTGLAICYVSVIIVFISVIVL